MAYVVQRMAPVYAAAELRDSTNLWVLGRRFPAPLSAEQGPARCLHGVRSAMDFAAMERSGEVRGCRHGGQTVEALAPHRHYYRRNAVSAAEAVDESHY